MKESQKRITSTKDKNQYGKALAPGKTTLNNKSCVHISFSEQHHKAILINRKMLKKGQTEMKCNIV